MLVLSRKLNEVVVIGGNIRVEVVSIRGNQVRLMFDAPEDIKIYREEIIKDKGLEQKEKS